MKIGTRITLYTITLVMLTLGTYGYVSVRNQRAELESDLERELAPVGAAVRVAIEAALTDGLYHDVSLLVGRWQAAEPTIGFVYIDFAHSRAGEMPPGFAVQPRTAAPDGGVAGDGDADTYVPPPADSTRLSRLIRLTEQPESAPFFDHVTMKGQPSLVLVEPIYGKAGTDAEERLVGAVELARDEGNTNREIQDVQRNVILVLAGLGVLLTLLVWLSARGAISSPLKRLVEAIDDVTRGDLGRVILRERDDEIGDLADRFNIMTKSLRDAREEILHGVDAKLALEARLRHSEKLATIGQLAAGIAHEVGTPLNVIGGRARTMEKKSNDPAEVEKNAGIIATQTQRITRIIQQLLDFARRPVQVRAAVNLEEVVRTCLDFLEHQLHSGRIEVERRKFTPADEDGEGDDPSTPIVAGDSDQLQQVCLNLCVNAIQAMPQGGLIQIGVRGMKRRRPGLDVSAPGRYVTLEIADSGPGIPVALRERIFEPFYSTKQFDPNGARDSGGTGLGLAVSVGIVKDHDGWIDIDDRPGGGTIFRVFLPAYDPGHESGRLASPK